MPCRAIVSVKSASLLGLRSFDNDRNDKSAGISVGYLFEIDLLWIKRALARGTKNGILGKAVDPPSNNAAPTMTGKA